MAQKKSKNKKVIVEKSAVPEKKTRLASWQKHIQVTKIFPHILVLFGMVGLLASSILIIEKITLLREPAADLSCNLNPIYSCSNVIKSEQAEVLGFPNELMGIAMFAALITLGVVLFAKAKLPNWFWKLFALGMLGSMSFVIWFFYQSVYVVGSLCIFCSSIWFSTWTISVVGYSWLYDKGFFQLKEGSILARIASLLRKNVGLVWFLFILLIATLILNHFWYYYGPVLGF